MHMAPNIGPQSLQARILEAPTLQYGVGSRQATIVSIESRMPRYILTMCLFYRNHNTERGTCE